MESECEKKAHGFKEKPNNERSDQYNMRREKVRGWKYQEIL